MGKTASNRPKTANEPAGFQDAKRATEKQSTEETGCAGAASISAAC